MHVIWWVLATKGAWWILVTPILPFPSYTEIYFQIGKKVIYVNLTFQSMLFMRFFSDYFHTSFNHFECLVEKLFWGIEFLHFHHFMRIGFWGLQLTQLLVTVSKSYWTAQIHRLMLFRYSKSLIKAETVVKSALAERFIKLLRFTLVGKYNFWNSRLKRYVWIILLLIIHVCIWRYRNLLTEL